ncbi:hypothetical protein H4219_004910 [Mycoemilia scoparia]|uniref:HIT-type domain-containing protein n=1 Tax=Mycoemilia scoparia TaxID=417184 RepID=A0A9W8DKS3_9FUNG|nr:hypothetical protein H4219_004910 [Mycoemilia scoparia]
MVKSKYLTTKAFGTCQICESNPASYNCPRCDTKYCSLECYKHEKHNQCSETFYQKQVHDALKEQGKDDLSEEEKKEMLDLLKEYHEALNQDQDYILDQMGENDIFERFGDLNLESASAEQIWERMSWKERREFESLISSSNSGGGGGSMSNVKQDKKKPAKDQSDGDDSENLNLEQLIDVWKPWWTNYKPVIGGSSPLQPTLKNPKIQKIVANQDNSKESQTPPSSTEQQKQQIPEIVDKSSIKPLDKLLTKPPHPSVLNQIIFLILAYVYTSRHLNGISASASSSISSSHSDNSPKLIRKILTEIAPFLYQKRTPIYSSADEVIVTGFENIQKYEHRNHLPLEAKTMLLDDIETICSNPNLVLAVLSELYRLFNIEQLPPPPPPQEQSKHKKHLFLAASRLYFLISVAYYFTPSLNTATTAGGVSGGDNDSDISINSSLNHLLPQEQQQQQQQQLLDPLPKQKLDIIKNINDSRENSKKRQAENSSRVAVWGSVVSQIESIKSGYILDDMEQKHAESNVKRLTNDNHSQGGDDDDALQNCNKDRLPLIQKIADL